MISVDQNKIIKDASIQNKLIIKNSTEIDWDELYQYFLQSKFEILMINFIMKESLIYEIFLKIQQFNQYFDKLTELNLSTTLISDKDFEIITKTPHLSNLRILNLNECFKLTSVSYQNMAKSLYLKLSHLDLSYNTINNNDLKDFGLSENFSNLKVLILIGCGNVTDDGLFNLSQSPIFSNLEKINIMYTQMTNKSFYYLCNSTFSKKLKFISVLDLGVIDTNAMKYLFESQLELETLDISSTRINNQGIDYLIKSKSGKSLKKLKLIETHFIMPSAINEVFKLSQLESLDLSWSNIDDGNLDFLIQQNGCQLKEFSIANCSSLSINLLEKLLRSDFMNQLSILNISWNHLQGEQLFKILSSVLPKPNLKELQVMKQTKNCDELAKKKDLQKKYQDEGIILLL